MSDHTDPARAISAEERVDEALRNANDGAGALVFLRRAEAVRIAEEHAEAAVAEMRRERDGAVKHAERADMEVAELRSEIERERMRLAACGVAAMANTPEAFARETLAPDSVYHSASYDDVRRIVQSEMELRKERDEYRGIVETLREARRLASEAAHEFKQERDAARAEAEACKTLLGEVELAEHNGEHAQAYFLPLSWFTRRDAAIRLPYRHYTVDFDCECATCVAVRAEQAALAQEPKT